jgi:nickel/cobalt exporter
MTVRLPILASVVLAAVCSLIGAGPASAHPLGNATVSQALAVTIGANALEVQAVVDMAEIPAFSALQQIDDDGDGSADEDERRRWAASGCEQRAREIAVRLDGGAPALSLVAAPRLSFPPGLGGLETLRLECPFIVRISIDPGPTHRIEVTDAAADARPGWHEITVAGGPGIEVVESDVPAVSPTGVLTAYPDELLTAPLDVRSASALVVATVSDAAGSVTAGSDPVADGGTLPQDALVTILTAPAASGGMLGAVIALLLSAGLGAVHALSPGHGKALVAASLIGAKGTRRQAIWLGLVVAASHTAGVLVLGAVVLGAGQLLAPDRVLAWLSLVAGGCVIAVGLALVIRSVGARPGVGEHGHDHPHPHPHPHPHAHRPDHGGGLGARAIIGLGLFGGLVPSTSAIVVLLIAVTTGRLVHGLALIVAYGAGMAVALAVVAVAAAMVGNRIGAGVVAGRPLTRRIAAAIPLASGGAVLVAGAAMTIGALGAVL